MLTTTSFILKEFWSIFYEIFKSGYLARVLPTINLFEIKHQKGYTKLKVGKGLALGTRLSFPWFTLKGIAQKDLCQACAFKIIRNYTF